MLNILLNHSQLVEVAKLPKGALIEVEVIATK